MAGTIVVANQKGGVGKTTTAVNLGAYLADAGRKVMLIDFDPQGNLTSSLGVETSQGTIYDVLIGARSISQVARPTAIENLSVIPASIHLAGANVELAHQENREYYLKRVVQQLKDDYHYVFIDCPPSLGILTLNGMAAADKVLIPLQCEYFALEGLGQLLQSIKRVQQGINPQLELAGILFTMYDSRTKLANDVVKEVLGYFGNSVYKTIIPRSVRLAEAPSHSMPIGRFAPESSGAKGYRELCEEFLTRG